ncbi:sugar kinase [Paenibacillus alkalitolerans]|uniref:sugar kinase n=1 Tax=Paenibacillus alkalitolerans TaxID=2799335 RepID=UPI0018F68E82|nr:sugar kinase [Paenibacillus alkalitolerans]
MKPEIVTFGETMALLTPQGSKGIEYSETLTKGFGGAESNVAIGLSRLGAAAGWFSRLGDDPFGRYIRKTLQGEGVDVSRAALIEGETTGLMMRELEHGKTSVYYMRKGSAASRMSAADIDEDYIAGAKLLHITGITPALSESCREAAEAAVRIAKKHGVKVSFDPNLRLKLWTAEEARSVLLPLASQADYFLPGYDELLLLYATDNDEEILGKVKQLQCVTVIKSWGERTVVVQADDVAYVPWFPADAIDPVGAGDAFAAAFLAGIARGLPPVEAALRGNAAGSLAVRTPGDWEGYPNERQLQRVIDNSAFIER